MNRNEEVVKLFSNCLSLEVSLGDYATNHITFVPFSSLFTYVITNQSLFCYPSISTNFPQKFTLQKSCQPPTMRSTQQLVAKCLHKAKKLFTFKNWDNFFFRWNKKKSERKVLSKTRALERVKFQVLTPRSLSINWKRKTFFFGSWKSPDWRCARHPRRLLTDLDCECVLAATCFRPFLFLSLQRDFFSPFFSMKFCNIF